MNFFPIEQEKLEQLLQNFETPFYLYDERTLRARIDEMLNFPNAFGLTVRYAMKANSTRALLQIMDRQGLSFDASSTWEVRRALAMGISPDRILLTAQEISPGTMELLEQGVKFNATSFHQLESYGRHFPGSSLGLRINPGMGGGHNRRTNVGGPGSSFGIWHEYIPKLLSIASKMDLSIRRLHFHVGSGSDPAVWEQTVDKALQIIEAFPDALILNLGGGFKVARMPGEINTDTEALGNAARSKFEAFARRTGRRLHLEIEPGTRLVAESGILVSRITDIVDTGSDGYRFLRLDAGMTDLTRPTLYGVHHPMKHIALNRRSGPEESPLCDAVVVGHCCESGDIFTPEPGNPENFVTAPFRDPRIGDAILFGVSGAYASSMSLANYNSFPRAPEYLMTEPGECVQIRKRQNMQQITENEIPLP